MTKIKNETTINAHKIFLDMLPAPWSVQENSCDDGIDYDISSGTACAVNIKGTAQPSYCGDCITCVIESDRLNYYRNNAKPIFIVLVDTESQNAYWLFIQEYIESILEEKQPHWRSKKSVNVKIPLANSLRDSVSKFNAAILSAGNLVLLIQYKLLFLTVATSLQSAVNDSQPYLHNSCSSDICSCFSSDELALYQAYLTAGEIHYQKYISSLHQHNYNGCFNAVHELKNYILRTINEGKYFVTAQLTLRLADIYFSTFTVLSKSVGVNQAMTLMDCGEILLEKAHDLVTKLETPNRILN